MNVAIVGGGAIANSHLAVWRGIADTKVVAICDKNQEVAQEVASRWRVPAVYSEFSALLDQVDATIIDICTPPQTHAALALEAISCRRHVLLEKPMAMTVREADKIVRSQKAQGVALGVIHNWLFEPVVLKARSLAENGHIGDVVAMHVEVLNTQEDPMIANPDHWCHALPGGRLGEMLAHPIYLLQAFLGHTTVESVLAGKRGNYPWVRFDELQAVLAGKRGVGSFHASFNMPREAIILNIYGTRKTLRIDVIGQTLVELGPLAAGRIRKAESNLRQALQLLGSTLGAGVLFASGRWQSGHARCIRAFAEALRSNAPPPVTVDEAYNTVETLEDICRKIEGAG